ncbi:hypothetical protein HYC85_006120 [Camellia sinensis]|uniref:FH2 domain-containing protein n=1 Tax=Camellia sinensis TaxID=4442 RepID=A0A7J7I2A1_CAMSI|nr:hypothetical protein HYC85_006120 [Camellia sinensis]
MHSSRPAKDAILAKKSADRQYTLPMAAKTSRWPLATAGGVWGCLTRHSLPLQGKMQVFGAKPDTKRSNSHNQVPITQKQYSLDLINNSISEVVDNLSYRPARILTTLPLRNFIDLIPSAVFLGVDECPIGGVHCEYLRSELLFPISFEHVQVNDLRCNLNTINAAAREVLPLFRVKESTKLHQVMQTILTLGNALNQGTALLELSIEKMPELLDFDKDLVHLEAASKVCIFLNVIREWGVSSGVVQFIACSIYISNGQNQLKSLAE